MGMVAIQGDWIERWLLPSLGAHIREADGPFSRFVSFFVGVKVGEY